MPPTIAEAAMPSQRTWVLVRAFFIAPLVTPVVFVSLRVASAGFNPARTWQGTLEDLIVGFLMFTMIAYLAAVLLGVPMFWTYQKLGVRSILAYVSAGFVIALITTTVISGITGGLFHADHSLKALARTALLLFVCGGGSGVVFRVLAFRR
jgi:hypothetical protein